MSSVVWCGWLVQSIVAEINAAIGATGVISTQCKQLVDDYAAMIMDMLEQKVRNSPTLCIHTTKAPVARCTERVGGHSCGHALR